MNKDEKRVATSTVEISISCKDLINKDVLSKSDPMCVVFKKGADHWVEILRTETVEDNLDPDFAEKLVMEYRFEERQQLRFELYDVDEIDPENPEDLSNHDFMGFHECTLGAIVSNGPKGYSATLKDDKERHKQKLEQKPEKTGSCVFDLSLDDSIPDDKENEANAAVKGVIILIAEELVDLKDEVQLQIGGSSLGKPTCFFIPPKLFFQIFRLTESGKFNICYRSVMGRGPNPIWPTFALPVRKLCNGNRDLNLKIEVFQVKALDPISIGFCITTLNKMMSLGTGGFPLTGNDGNTIVAASVTIFECVVQPSYSFVDYIQNGTQINCHICIDFSASNGDPKKEDSLHFTAPIAANAPNPYEQAIVAVGAVMEDYDSDKMFPVYGFGAKIPPQMQPSHNFYITLTDNPNCRGIGEILEYYRTCISKIELYAPTNFSPVIKFVSEQASHCMNGENYFVLLVITDGMVTDMPDTKEAIIEASNYPVSVIIVGVGDEDYSQMEVLDGDSTALTHKGKKASRDIVQFVPYRNAEYWVRTNVGRGMREKLNLQAKENNEPTDDGDGTGKAKASECQSIQKMAQEKLAKEVLGEVPEQLTTFMRRRGILPGLKQKVEEIKEETVVEEAPKN